MKKYLPKNGNVIVRQGLTESRTASGIIIAQGAREQRRTATVLASDTDIVKVGDEIIADLSSGSYLEEDEEGSVLSIPESEIIAVVEDK